MNQHVPAATLAEPADAARTALSAVRSEVAKAVVIFGDEGYHMIVVPANKLVDFQEVRLTLGLTHARLATEDELARMFPDCELGAMPPFGNLYHVPVYLDSSLALGIRRKL